MLLSKIKKKNLFFYFILIHLQLKKNTIKMLYNIKHLFTSPKKKKKRVNKVLFSPMKDPLSQSPISQGSKLKC